MSWRGPDPHRVDSAFVVLYPDHLTARGTSCASEHALSYSLVTGPDWVTRTLAVTSEADGIHRRLELRRDPADGWSARREVDGEPAPVDLPDLDGALDCDLALCPLTNTMPVLRTGLLAGVTTTRLTMAWVEVPDLVVHASVQDYGPARSARPDGHAVHFASEGDETIIELDAEGLVVSYPGIGERLPA